MSHAAGHNCLLGHLHVEVLICGFLCSLDPVITREGLTPPRRSQFTCTREAVREAWDRK